MIHKGSYRPMFEHRPTHSFCRLFHKKVSIQ